MLRPLKLVALPASYTPSRVEKLEPRVERRYTPATVGLQLHHTVRRSEVVPEASLNAVSPDSNDA